MMRPLSSTNATKPGAPGPDVFLDTIPEDQSVAQQRVSNLSNVSAVASSDSDDENPQRQSQRKRRKHRDGSVASSDANALLQAGVGADSEGQHSKQPAGAFSCSPRTLAFSLLLLAITLAISLGVYFIVTRTDRSANKATPVVPSPSGAPSAELTFPPNFYVELNTDVPSTAPSLDPDTVAAIDQALLKMTDPKDYYNQTSPQGSCRNWMLTEDLVQPTVDEEGEAAVQQRYILCVFFTATNGPYFDAAFHECDWDGVSCDAGITVVLYINASNLTGTIPSELGYLSQLQLLSLRENDLTGTIPPEIMQLPNLTTLDLSYNKLTGTIPSAPSSSAARQTSQQYPPLENLYMYNNFLQGTVPFIDTMERLKVQNNLFTGFDQAYSTLQSLTSLKMYENLLTGPLPQTWDAPFLTYVDLANNFWAGSIPESMWNLPSIETLILHDSNLTGTLPEETVGSQWKRLWLHSNRFSGTIPVTFASDWVNLTELLLYNNSLSGAITEDQCQQWPNLTRLETDCGNVNVTCDCCTRCYGES